MTVFTRIVSVISLFTILLATPASTNAMTASVSNGKIAFSRILHGKLTIWTSASDGSNQQRITSKGGHAPVWSPDGRKLVVIDDEGRLQLMLPDGSKRQLLTNAHGYSDNSPVWSADGSKIAFVRQENSSTIAHTAVFAVQVSNKAETNISGWSRDTNYQAPSWNPDGTKLVFQRTSLEASLLVIKNFSTNTLKTLTRLSDIVDAQASWSPNGKKILFNDSLGQVYTIWPDGTHRSVISDGESCQATWSYDGVKIAFLEDPHDDSISISEADGTITWVTVQKKSDEKIAAPSWSPDGTKLLFTLSSETQGDQTASLFTVDLRTNLQTKIATNSSGRPSWQALR